MQITGIISEYNPFHNGHKYLIDEHKKRNPNTHFIAVMSGNFTQRGEAAILNKWQRAQLAIAGGIDLVLELPFVFAVRSAQHFAYGGIDLLNKLGCVNNICFGSENTNKNELMQIVQSFFKPEFSSLFQNNISQGLSYAAAVSKTLSQITNVDEAILKAPNTILGIEYLKAMQMLQAPFSVDIIKRKKAQHNDLNYQNNFASGTAIRHCLYKDNINFSELKQVVLQETFFLLQQAYMQKNLPQEDNLFLSLLSKLRLAKLNDIKKIYNVNEGLEFKLLKAATQAKNRQELLDKLKSKRYPLTKLQRMLLYIMLDLTKQQIDKFDKSGALYARVLAFNEKGKYILRQIKEKSALPIITKTTTYLDSKKRRQEDLTTFEEMLSIDTYATELYNLCFNPVHIYGEDFITSPIYVQSKN